MSAFGRLRKKIASIAARTEPRAGYVFVVEASGVVGIGHTSEISDAIAAVIAAGWRPDFIWATTDPGVEERVAALAKATLQDQGKATGNGWFKCSTSEAQTAIRDAAASLGFPDTIKFDLPEIRRDGHL